MKWTTSFWGIAKWEMKAESFYGIKNEEQRREKKKISDWPGPWSQPCLVWEGPGLAWSLEIGPVAILHLSGQVHLQGHKSYLSFSVTDTLGRSSFILGLEIYFNSNYFIIDITFSLLMKINELSLCFPNCNPLHSHTTIYLMYCFKRMYVWLKYKRNFILLLQMGNHLNW